tara:strand:+ start:121 stop:1473 length:1353 start_codon:yes stop_codon:yes gene_type:complete
MSARSRYAAAASPTAGGSRLDEVLRAGLSFTKLRLDQQADIATVEKRGREEPPEVRRTAMKPDTDKKTEGPGERELVVAFYHPDAEHPVFPRIQEVRVEGKAYNVLLTDYKENMSEKELQQLQRDYVYEQISELEKAGCKWYDDIQEMIRHGGPFVAAFKRPEDPKEDLILAGAVAIELQYSLEEYAHLMRAILQELVGAGEECKKWQFYTKKGTFGPNCPNLLTSMTDFNDEVRNVDWRRRRYAESELLRYSFLNVHRMASASKSKIQSFVLSEKVAELSYVCTINGNLPREDSNRIRGVLKEMTTVVELFVYQWYIVPTALRAYTEGWSAVEMPQNDRYNFLFEWIMKFTFLELHSVDTAIDAYEHVGYKVLTFTGAEMEGGYQRGLTYMVKSGASFVEAPDLLFPMAGPVASVPGTISLRQGGEWTRPSWWRDEYVPKPGDDPRPKP